MSVITTESPTPKRVMLLIPGLRDPDARGLLRLAPVFESAGYTTEALTYGMFLLRGIAWHLFNPPVAEMLRDTIRLLDRLGYEVNLCAHSNGGAIALAASDSPIYSITLINAAVETDARIGKGVKWLFDLIQPVDPILWASAMIPASPWGLGGVIGIQGDPRVQNISLREEQFGEIRGHGGGLVVPVAEKIVEAIEQSRGIAPLSPPK